MSFDIFVGFFRGGKPTLVPSAKVETAFAPFICFRQSGFYALSFPDGGGAEIFVPEGEDVASFMIARPPSSAAFWEALVAILRDTPNALYWPGGRPVVADAGAITHLPADMIDDLGDPVISCSPETIRNFITQS
jgi:hypothetical protein